MTQLYSSHTYHPQYDWGQAYFTDGSVQSTAEGTQVGAAVWSASNGQYLIRTNGEGPSETITRAEMAAISYTVEHLLAGRDETIFTDSQAVIHLVSRAIREPHTLRGHLHEPARLSIGHCLVERANAGHRTGILKVPDHTAIYGNEKADAAAKEAAHPDATHDYTMPAHKHLNGQWQQSFFEPPPLGREGPMAPKAVSNLHTALRKAIHPQTKTGTSKMGIYATASKAMYDGVAGDRALVKESNAFWHTPDITSGALCCILKHVPGQTWTKAKAQQWRVPYLVGRPGQLKATYDRCPLCGLTDGIAHMLLECSHPIIRSMIIARQDWAVRAIHKALQKYSRQGTAYTVLDACRRMTYQTCMPTANACLSFCFPTQMPQRSTSGAPTSYVSWACRQHRRKPKSKAQCKTNRTTRWWRWHTAMTQTGRKRCTETDATQQPVECVNAGRMEG